MLRCLMVLFALSVLICGCACSDNSFETTSVDENTESTEVPTYNSNITYSLEDFKTIVVGESTIKDVDMLADVSVVQMTYYGAYTEFPMGDGNAVCFKFELPDYKVLEMYVGEADLISSEFEMNGEEYLNYDAQQFVDKYLNN